MPAPLRSSHYVCVPTSSQFACVCCRSSIDTHWVPVHASHLCPNTFCVCVVGVVAGAHSSQAGTRPSVEGAHTHRHLVCGCVQRGDTHARARLPGGIPGIVYKYLGGGGGGICCGGHFPPPPPRAHNSQETVNTANGAGRDKTRYVYAVSRAACIKH